MANYDEDMHEEIDTTTAEGYTDKPPVQLSGGDGNVFAVICACVKAAKSAKWSQERISKFRDKVLNADSYDHVLQLCMEHFDAE